LEAAADHRRDDADRSEQDRQRHEIHVLGRIEPERGHARDRDDHRRDDRSDVGLEQVGAHARDVADVVADVVRDHGRVARIVLGNAGLDLADEVGADVGGLGVDAAADAREQRDRRGAERVAEEHLGLVLVEPEEHADAAETEADDHEPHHHAALEGEREGGAEAGLGLLGGAHRGAGRRVHAEVAGDGGEHAAGSEGQRGRAVAEQHQRPYDDRDEHREHAVLRDQERLGAGLDVACDLPHGLVTVWLLHQIGEQQEGVGDRGKCHDEGDDRDGHGPVASSAGRPRGYPDREGPSQ
jgi:hypothetical protein